MTDSDPTYTVIVTANKVCDSDRLDRVLSTELPDLSRARVQQLIVAGKVERVGWGTLLAADEKVKVGDVLCVDVPPSVPAAPQAEPIPLTVVFEDSSLVVIDKPANLVVHPGSANWSGTLVNAAAARYAMRLPAIKGRDRPGIVHRLDKDTSGLMVLAKTEPAFHHLAAQFASHSIERIYLAVTWGHPKPTRGRIFSYIGRSKTDRIKMANVFSDGKSATTYFETRGLLGKNAAIVACWPATGRTHQIRVHLSGLGCPVVGDPLYGRGKQTRLARRPDGNDGPLAVDRQALHAHVIGFEHPATGQKIRLLSELPSDINALSSLLENF